MNSNPTKKGEILSEVVHFAMTIYVKTLPRVASHAYVLRASSGVPAPGYPTCDQALLFPSWFWPTFALSPEKNA